MGTHHELCPPATCASVLTLCVTVCFPSCSGSRALPCPLQLNPPASLIYRRWMFQGSPSLLPILNPPAGAGTGQQRFWAGVQEPIPGVKLWWQLHNLKLLPVAPGCGVRLTTIRLTTRLTTTLPWLDMCSPGSTIHSLTLSFLQPRQTAALNHSQKLAKSCQAVCLCI